MMQVRRRRTLPGAESNGEAIIETTLQCKENGSCGMDSRGIGGGDGNSARSKPFGGISYRITNFFSSLFVRLS